MAQVRARQAAAQSVLYRLPTDGPLIDITAHGGDVQAAVNAAGAAGGYVYQASTDSTWYAQPAGNAIDSHASCRGMVGMRIRKGSNENSSRVDIIDMNLLTGDPYAASDGYKFIGCKLDGNGRGQNWQPYPSHAAYDYQFAHAISIRSTVSGQDVHVTINACEFHDGTGDAISAFNRVKCAVRSCTFYGYFRAIFLTNSDAELEYDIRRFESFLQTMTLLMIRRRVPAWNTRRRPGSSRRAGSHAPTLRTARVPQPGFDGQHQVVAERCDRHRPKLGLRRSVDRRGFRRPADRRRRGNGALPQRCA